MARQPRRNNASTQLATMMKDSCTPAPVRSLKTIPPTTVPSQTATPDLSE